MIEVNNTLYILLSYKWYMNNQKRPHCFISHLAYLHYAQITTKYVFVSSWSVSEATIAIVHIRHIVVCFLLHLSSLTYCTIIAIFSRLCRENCHVLTKAFRLQRRIRPRIRTICLASGRAWKTHPKQQLHSIALLMLWRAVIYKSSNSMSVVFEINVNLLKTLSLS